MWQQRLEELYVLPAAYAHRSWKASDESHTKFAQWARNGIQFLDEQKQEEGKTGKASDYIAGSLSIVDVQVYATLFWGVSSCPALSILQDLQGQIPWVQAWYD